MTEVLILSFRGITYRKVPQMVINENTLTETILVMNTGPKPWKEEEEKEEEYVHLTDIMLSVFINCYK